MKGEVKRNSRIMGLTSYLFGWRKFGIKRSDLVLEVGSGNRPFARSDVLFELGEYGQNVRYAGNVLSDIVIDRPFVFGNAHQLPFRNNSFDYLLSSHVLEHLEQPSSFLNEANRVSQRGCIITPSEIFERIFAEPSHFWYISMAGGRLRIQAKAPEDHGLFGSRFRELWAESHHLRKFLSTRPDVFEVHYYYRNGKIDFEVEGAISYPKKVELEEVINEKNYLRHFLTSEIRSKLGKAVRFFASKERVDLNTLLACPSCKENAIFAGNHVQCSGCGKRYPLRNGIPVMISSQSL